MFFLGAFIAIPILVIGVGLWRRGLVSWWLLVRVGVVAVLSATYLSLWANYLTLAQVWLYYSEFTLGLRVAYLPLEEYLFLMLYVLLAALGGLWIWQYFYPGDFD
jgi:lycopene cyclase domain-containing protein